MLLWVRDFLTDYGTRIIAFAVLVALIAFGVPPLWQHVRGLSWAYLGCPPATQLRMVTDLEDVARELIDALGNPIAMHSAADQRAQHEQIERAGEELRRLCCHRDRSHR